MNKSCIFCDGKFENYSIKRYKHWDLQLFRDDQYYIGRTAVVFKNRHIVDILELKMNERKELFETIIPELQSSLKKTFNPDLYNYSSIGNDCEHLHMHIIPRYKQIKTFAGQEFNDEYFDRTYARDHKQIKLNEDNIVKLIEYLRENI